MFAIIWSKYLASGNFLQPGMQMFTDGGSVRRLEGGIQVRTRQVLSLMLIVSLFLTMAGTVFAREQTIKIGFVGPLTGDVATYGQSAFTAIQLAFEEVNKQGGVLGMPIELVYEDNQGDAAETTNIVRKLIVRDRVSAIMGPIISANTLAAGPIAQQFRVPLITPTSTNDRVTEAGNYIFSTCFSDSFQGEIMGRFAAETLGLKRVAVLTNVASDYSIGLTEVFTKTFESLGGKVVAQESYNAGDQDFRAQLTKIKGADVEAIYLPVYYNDAALIARQARQLGITALFLGPDGFDSPKLFEIGGDAVYGSYFTAHYSTDDDSPRVQKFIADYRARYGQDPDAFAALGYDAAIVLVEAIKRAGSTKPADIRDALAATENLEVVTGNLSMDENRKPIKSAVVLKVVPDGYEFVERVDP